MTTGLPKGLWVSGWLRENQLGLRGILLFFFFFRFQFYVSFSCISFLFFFFLTVDVFISAAVARSFPICQALEAGQGQMKKFLKAPHESYVFTREDERLSAGIREP